MMSLTNLLNHVFNMLQLVLHAYMLNLSHAPLLYQLSVSIKRGCIIGNSAA